MKSAEFKKILKPLIKQTIKEVLFEEGILSNIVSEVAKGLSGDLVVETKTKKNNNAELKRKELQYERSRQERIKRLNESTSFNSNVFENTQPIPTSNTHSPLAGTSADDSGINISEIQKLAKGKWKHLI
jgi:hypothetical protein